MTERAALEHNMSVGIYAAVAVKIDGIPAETPVILVLIGVRGLCHLVL